MGVSAEGELAMKNHIVLLTLVLMAQSQVTALADTTGDGIDATVISDSFDKESEDMKQQIEGAESQNMSQPPSAVMTTKEKSDAGRESSAIINQIPDRRKLKAKRPDGTLTVALALGGGGARGAAHIGVLKVLEAEHITLDQIVGNSMGSIVGGLYCAGVPLADIDSHLSDGSLRRAYMPGGIGKRIAFLPFTKFVHPFRPKHYAGLWSGEKLTNYLDSILPRPNMDIADTPIPFSAVATNLLDGKAYRITKGRLSTAMKASAAISPLIQPVAIDGKLFVDGGVRANLPASAARGTGAGFVIAVLVDEPMQVLPAKQFMRLRKVASRMADIVLAIADERQLQFADMVINPNVSSIPVLSNDPADVIKAIHAGEVAARKAIPELRRRLHMTQSTAYEPSEK
jgi:NTE family protein